VLKLLDHSPSQEHLAFHLRTNREEPSGDQGEAGEGISKYESLRVCRRRDEEEHS
jgi:hypothetical protein